MKITNLCKIELYRFYKSMEIVKYFILTPAVLFLMCYINVFSVKMDISASAVWGSMSSIYMYMIASMSVLIAIYVGREYRYKTINYEVVNGYGICKIAVSKTVTCGIIVPFIYILCMSAYLMILTDCYSKELLFRIFLLFIIYIHICSTVLLYVMLFKNGIIGGSIAFMRFYIGESIGQSLVTNLGTEKIQHIFSGLQVFNQWYEIINIENPVKTDLVFRIIVVMMIEYVVLLCMLRMFRKYVTIQ